MDDEKKLTGEEKRALLKEQFKKDLKAKQEILNQMKYTNNIEKIESNLTNMLNMSEKLTEADDMIEKLNQKSALNEAKLEISLDSVSDSSKDIETNVESTKTLIDIENKSEIKLEEKKSEENKDTKTLGDEKV